jgi:hypothetical protein
MNAKNSESEHHDLRDIQHELMAIRAHMVDDAEQAMACLSQVQAASHGVV